MTIERPMFPPRAESVDSFSHQPAIGPPGSQTLAGDSLSPVKGLSRRNLLAGMATLPVAVGIPATVPPVNAAVQQADPIYAVIEKHRAAAAVWDAAVDVRSNFNDLDMTDEQWEHCDELDDAVEDAWRPCELAGIDLVNTKPATQAGIVAAIAYIRIQMLDDGTYMPHRMEFKFNPGSEGDAKETMAWIDAFLHTIASAAGELGKAVRS